MHAVAADHHHRVVRDDALAAAGDVAAHHRAHPVRHRVRDVDALGEGPGSRRSSSPRPSPSEADVDAVQLRADDSDVLEPHALRALDVDPVRRRRAPSGSCRKMSLRPQRDRRIDPRRPSSRRPTRAATATPPSSSATPTYVSGSTRDTPNNSDSSSRLAATRHRDPMVTPATTSDHSRPTTCRTMFGRRRTQCRANADLAHTLGHAAGDDAIQADCRQQQRGDRERLDHDEREPSLRRRRRDERVHRRDLLDRLIGVDRPDRALDLRRERRGVAASFARRATGRRPTTTTGPPARRTRRSWANRRATVASRHRRRRQ